jgi:hypothetical protein
LESPTHFEGIKPEAQNVLCKIIRHQQSYLSAWPAASPQPITRLFHPHPIPTHFGNSLGWIEGSGKKAAGTALSLIIAWIHIVPAHALHGPPDPSLGLHGYRAVERMRVEERLRWRGGWVEG